MLSPRSLRCLAAFTLLALAWPDAALAQNRKNSRKAKQPKVEQKAPEKADALPELISTEGEAPKWKNRRELEAAAAKGDPLACMELGETLFAAVPSDPVKARPLYEKAAEAGIPNAFFRLGKIHHDGLGVAADQAKAFNYYLEAAKRGVPEAQYNVGAQLSSGRGVRRNFTEGLAWLIVATKSGAAGDGEKLLRERLKSRPADIAAGEKRAAAIQDALAKGLSLDAPAAPSVSGHADAPPRRPSSSAPLPEPPKIERPTFQPERPAAPKIDAPVVPVPPPELPGKP